MRTGGIDEVLYNQEVAGETHGLHDIEFKDQPLLDFVRKRITIQPPGSVKCQLSQIVGLQFDTVEFVIPAQSLDFCLGRLLIQHDTAIFVLRKFIEKILFSEPSPVLFFRSELCGDGKCGHDRRMVNGVIFHLIEHLQRIGKCVRHIGKQFVHLRLGFHPLLLGVEHPGRVVQILARTEAYQAIVCLGIFFVHKVNIVRADDLDVVFLRIFQQFGIGLLLHRIGFVIGPRHRSPVPLQFQIVVVPKEVLVPADGLFGSLQVVIDNLLGHLSTDTGRAYNQSLVKLLQLASVGTGTHVIPLCPSPGHQFYQIVISLLIFGQHHQVPSALVRLSLLLVHRTPGHIHLTSHNRLEQSAFRLGDSSPASRQFGLLVFAGNLTALDASHPFLQILHLPFRAAVLLVDVIGEFLNGKHISMVGHSNTLHTVFHGLVDQTGDAGLPIEQRILGMDV